MQREERGVKLMTFNYRGSSLGLVSRGSLGAQHMSVPSKKRMIYALSTHGGDGSPTPSVELLCPL